MIFGKYVEHAQQTSEAVFSTFPDLRASISKCFTAGKWKVKKDLSAYLGRDSLSQMQHSFV